MKEGGFCVLEAACFLHRGAMICQNTDRFSCNNPNQLCLPDRIERSDISPPVLPNNNPQLCQTQGSTPKPQGCRDPAPSPPSPPLRRRLRIPAARPCSRLSPVERGRHLPRAGLSWKRGLKATYISAYFSLCIYNHFF